MKNKNIQFLLGGVAALASLVLVFIIAKSVIAIALPTPQINGISPISGPIAGNTAVTITGVNFDYIQTVFFDGLPATIQSSTPTTINVTTPAHPAGPVDVTVNTNGFTTSASAAYAYVDNTSPPPPPVNDPCAKHNKIAVCHLPPGNVENEHTLCLPQPAIKAHLAHGDYLGVCKSENSRQISD